MTAAEGGGASGAVRGWAPYVLTALLIWLGWQVVVQLLIQRAPPEIAVRVAPGSPAVLSRAAEAELAAGRVDQARDLSEMALRGAPFDVRALRVLGLAVARTDEDAADPILTLAGNWSLRDGPSHAWLTTRRLRAGDYVGAFGHADVLARRREELRPDVFRLFARAAALDPRAVPALLQRVAARPGWRGDFLEFLRTDADGPAVQAALAVGLDGRPGELTDHELEVVYLDWVTAGRLPGLVALRARTGRPAPATLVDGGFDGRPSPAPFRWSLDGGPGVIATLSEDGSQAGGQALFIESDGFGDAAVASQLLFLPVGAHTLTYAVRTEAGTADPRLRWTLTCVETGALLTAAAAPEAAGRRTVSVSLTVPPERCTAQWLKLETVRGARRVAIEVWIDDVAITRTGVR